MTEQSKVLDRIRKVLALAEGTNNPAEAATMMEKVQAMLDEHNLSLLDVAHADADDPIGTDMNAAYCWVSNSWVKPVAHALAELYGCRMVYGQRKNKISFDVVGRQSARVTWSLMLPFVLQQVRAEAKELRDKDITEIVATTSWDWDRAAKQTKGVGSYERAVGNALSFRIWKLVQESKTRDAARVATGERALVPVDLLEAELADKFPALRESRASSLRTTGSAKAAAGRVSLHRQATGAGQQRIGS